MVTNYTRIQRFIAGSKIYTMQLAHLQNVLQQLRLKPDRTEFWPFACPPWFRPTQSCVFTLELTLYKIKYCECTGKDNDCSLLGKMLFRTWR